MAVKHKNSNCFMHDKMVDFPKFGHIYVYSINWNKHEYSSVRCMKFNHLQSNCHCFILNFIATHVFTIIKVHNLLNKNFTNCNFTKDRQIQFSQGFLIFGDCILYTHGM